MNPIAAAYQTIERRLTAWASAQPDVRAAFVFGSRVRSDHVADPWSDLDVLLACTDPARYWHEDAWLANMGEVWFSFTEPTPDGGFERRALYAGGLDVDYAPDPVAAYERMLEEGVSPFGASLIRRGARVLVDKDGLLARLIALVPSDEPPWATPIPPRPSAAPQAA